MNTYTWIALIIILIIVNSVLNNKTTTKKINKIKKIGKKNCYECKNYQLYDVCSCGDGFGWDGNS